jgi:hypothetical protein
MFRVQIKWGKRTEIIVAHNQETLNKLLAWHNDKPIGKGYCRVKVLEAAE